MKVFNTVDHMCTWNSFIGYDHTNCCLYYIAVLLLIVAKSIFLTMCGFQVAVFMSCCIEIQGWYVLHVFCIIGPNLLGWMPYWRITIKIKTSLLRKESNKWSLGRFLMQTRRRRMLRWLNCQNVLTSARKRHNFILFCLCDFLFSFSKNNYLVLVSSNGRFFL